MRTIRSWRPHGWVPAESDSRVTYTAEPRKGCTAAPDRTYNTQVSFGIVHLARETPFAGTPNGTTRIGP